MDALDLRILDQLQRDATPSLDQLASNVGSSRTPVWNRIRKLRERGVIDRQVAVLNPDHVGLGGCFFVLVRTSEHETDWLARFQAAVEEIPEIVEAHRLAGDVDYILKVRVRDARDYDRFYKELVSKVKIFNVTSL
ncbi:MAG: Lrp/AsnC family transcriptional regulator, partial [Pseudomonadota bacterium]